MQYLDYYITDIRQVACYGLGLFAVNTPHQVLKEINCQNNTNTQIVENNTVINTIT